MPSSLFALIIMQLQLYVCASVSRRAFKHILIKNGQKMVILECEATAVYHATQSGAC